MDLVGEDGVKKRTTNCHCGGVTTGEGTEGGWGASVVPLADIRDRSRLRIVAAWRQTGWREGQKFGQWHERRRREVLSGNEKTNRRLNCRAQRVLRRSRSEKSVASSASAIWALM